MRRIVTVAAAVALAAALVVTPFAAASAADESEYTPSKSKYRAWMLNVTGSVLGQAMPKPWQREQLANRFAQGGLPSGEQLNQQFGMTALVKGPDGVLRPEAPAGSGTYDDIVIAEQEKIRNKTSKRKGVVVPASPLKKMTKTIAGEVGGGVTALLALETGTFLGSMFAPVVGSWFGVDDTTGAVCAQISGEPSELLSSWVTGVDCEAWRLANEYVPNSDAAKSWSAATFNGGSVRWTRWAPARSGVVYPCYSYTAPTSWVAPGGGTAALYIWTGSAWMQVSGPHVPSTHSSWDAVRDACPVIWTGTGYDSPAPNMRFQVGATVVGTPPVESVTDPERTQDCTIKYTDGTTDVATGAPYKESGGEVAPATCPPPDAGKVVDEVVITESTGPGSTPQELYREGTTDAYQDWAQKEECATGTCLLDLLIETSPDKYASCFDLQEGCAGWFEDPTRDAKYTCRYGLDEVALAECFVYAGLFTPGRIEVGAPYSDPMTGVWSGGSNAPKPDRDAMGQTVQNPATYRSCDGMNVTGFDPVGFVMRPIQCALEWAFVPRPVVVEAEAASIKSKWEETAPGAVITTVAGWSFAAPSGGCGGLVVPWSTILGHGVPDWNILNACPGSPLVPAATASMVILSISAVMGLIYVVTASFGGAVGFNRGLGGGRS